MQALNLNGLNEAERLKALTDHEWLETNGLGGYSSSTLAGCNTRRYHGLLVAAIRPPTERSILLAKLDERIEFANNIWELSTSFYPETIHPEGFKTISNFKKDLFPEWNFEIEGKISIRKSIMMLHGENTVIIKYELISAPTQISLIVNPKISGRSYHALKSHTEPQVLDLRAKQDLISADFINGASLHIHSPDSRASLKQDWYYNYVLPRELERGYDWQEDLISCGELTLSLKPGETKYIVASTINPIGRPAKKLFEEELERRASLLRTLPLRSKIARDLTLAADQFIVKRQNKTLSIIAGYPWFTDWGRDSMIALSGLCLTTGRISDAKSILETFLNHMQDGLIPNLFPNGTDKPMYNTIDATLWMFVAIYRYLQRSEDKNFIRKIAYHKLKESIELHLKGTIFNIHTNEKGLLEGGNEKVQLTWMDAKIGDYVVTPRNGMAVEINALWINALRIMEKFSEISGHPEDTKLFSLLARTAEKSFIETFWLEQEKYLADTVYNNEKDRTLRPNQIITLALPFEVLDTNKAKLIIKIVREKLLTPFGLRTLPQEDRRYHSKYEGDQPLRDIAYHQGTVWNWLLGSYIEAILRYEGSSGREEAKELLSTAEENLTKCCFGSISEIFDGELPHNPRGAIAQAWSIGETLRSIENLELSEK